MSRRCKLTSNELQSPFAGVLGEKYGVILSPARFAELLGLSRKTVYGWIADGRLTGCFAKRGKHILIWRDKALDRIFNGDEWNGK